MMKLISAAAFVLISTSAFAADEYVSGYTRSNGTYVEPHHQTSPDSGYDNNYSSKGNINPYTGQSGTVSYDQYQRKESGSIYR